jgi:translation initiation factor IF-3
MKAARKKQSIIVVKEMKMRPKIDTHDYETKKKHVVRFLTHGDKVKVTIMFRGREMTHTELGGKLLQRLADDLGDISTVEARPKLDGRNMTMVLAPTHIEKKEDEKEHTDA